MRHTLFLGVALMTISTSPAAARSMVQPPQPPIEAVAIGDAAAPITYPETKKVDVVEDHFGMKVADPYRWLEDDVRVNPEVAKWVEDQNKVTDAYLDTLPGREVLKARMKKLYDYERFGIPSKAGKNYFFTKNDGLQNQSVLYVRSGLKAKERVLIDPNTWAKDGATALGGWAPSDNGKLLAYSIQDGGTDWRIIKVMDVATGKVLDDEVRWAKYSGISWIGNEGFLYSRFDAPKEGAAFQQLTFNQKVYFHRVGTPQSADELVYATPDRPELGHSAQATQDGKWALITSSKGTDEKYELHLIPLGPKATAPRKWEAVTLVKGLDYEWNLIDGIGDNLYFVTNKDAPKLKVVRAIPPSACPAPPSKQKCRVVYDGPWGFEDIIAERTETLANAEIVGDRLILSYLQDAKSLALMTTLDGVLDKKINLQAIGTASGFGGKPGDPETFYSFSSYNQPGAVYRFDTKSGKSTVFAKPKLSFDPASIMVEQVFYPSKDGTKIPMFIVRRKDLANAGKAAPTVLYGYGGFNVSQTPGFSPTRMAWIQSGGVFAVANLRGGGEYGKPWHDAGRLQNKQNVFDDFIAAGEYLIAQGITGQDQLAIQGGSNGGLLVGAAVNQRPDLFAAGHAAVGVMDMIRFDRFTAGRYWIDDYGDPAKEADFKMQMSYSPLHNIKSGVDYPAVIVTTADTDDRVVPGHSFKYTAALQAADAGDKPHIIRVETRAGHGSGKPTDKVIDEYADVFAFLAKWTGLELTEAK
jgi:prolyl oligopeptidase